MKLSRRVFYSLFLKECQKVCFISDASNILNCLHPCKSIGTKFPVAPSKLRKIFVLHIKMTSLGNSSTVSSPGLSTNLFMSHSWDIDLRGRSTHARVRALKTELNRLGWKVWFDEEQLLIGCNIDMKMASGITGSDAVCVCVTRKYIEKINSQARNDNCAKEWNFAQAIGKKILPIIMEEEMLDIRAWPHGLMTMYLSNTFYVDCTSDDIKGNAKKLDAMLILLGLKKRKLATRYSWPLVGNRRLAILSSVRNRRRREVVRDIIHV